MIVEDLNVSGSKVAGEEARESRIWQAQLCVWPLWWPGGEGHHPPQLLHWWYRGNVQGKHTFKLYVVSFRQKLKDDRLSVLAAQVCLFRALSACSLCVSCSDCKDMFSAPSLDIRTLKYLVLLTLHVFLTGTEGVPLCGRRVPWQYDEAGGGLQGNGVYQHLPEIQTGLQLTGG